MTKQEKKENINKTAGRIVGIARMLKNDRLLEFSIKICNDLKRLKVYDEERI